MSKIDIKGKEVSRLVLSSEKSIRYRHNYDKWRVFITVRTIKRTNISNYDGDPEDDFPAFLSSLLIPR